MNSTVTARADASRIETGDGDIWLRGADPAAARELRRADDVFPFTPDTFVDELVSLCAADDNGAPLTAAQFRALPLPVKSAIVAALLHHHAGAHSEAALPRAPKESDASHLLRNWRYGAAERAIAERVIVNGQDDATPTIIAAAHVAEKPAAPVAETPLAEKPPETHAPLIPPPRRGGSRAALLLATMACLLAIATLGVSMAMLLRQDGVDQAMMRHMREQQDQMMAATRANQAAIATLTSQIKASAIKASAIKASDIRASHEGASANDGTEPAAPMTQDGKSVMRVPPDLRTTKSRYRTPRTRPIWPSDLDVPAESISFR